MANSNGKQMSVGDRIRRVTNVVRVIAVIVLLALLGSGIYTLVRFYSDRVGLTAPRAVETYVRALASGDADTVYAMTDRASLTDLYGRPVERSAFVAAVRSLAGPEPVPVSSVAVTKLFDKGGSHYYEATVSYASRGAQAKRLVFELRNQDGAWLVTWPVGISP